MASAWYENAKLLREGIAASDGGKLLSIERVSGELGLSPQTAHHLLRAAAFIETVSETHPQLTARLKSMPYQAVLPIERWFHRDPAGLVDFLHHNPKISVRELIRSEKESRRSDGDLFEGEPVAHFSAIIATLGGPIAPGPRLKQLLKFSQLELGDLASLRWARSKDAYAKAIGIEAVACLESGPVAGIQVGPNSPTMGRYNRSAKTIWANSVCAASLTRLLFVLLPNAAARDACLTSMPVPPSGESGWPNWNDVQPKRGLPRSRPARPAGPSGGIIIFTTPELVIDDWQT